jgi:hypothetical protein
MENLDRHASGAAPPDNRAKTLDDDDRTLREFHSNEFLASHQHGCAGAAAPRVRGSGGAPANRIRFLFGKNAFS